MDREKLRDKVKKDIRALLISAPLGVPAHIFAKDYRQMNGKEVPYREIGHRTLDEFILSIPDVVRMGMGPTGMPTFYPVATKETQHIVDMIRKQKKPSIKKAVIPSAIVARKTPIKMSSFSRKGGFGGGGYTPRGGGGAYRRPQAKYHPRSQSMPASNFPNLPPRLQRQHQHSSTYQPRWQPPPTTWHSQQHSQQQYQQQYQQRGVARSRVGGRAAEEASSRPRLNSLPENSNRLHPQHALSSASAGKPAPPPLHDTASGVSELWSSEFGTAHHMTVEELNSWALNNPKQQPAKNPVYVDGVTGRHKRDLYMDKVVVKVLLQSLKYKRGKRDSPFEAVQLLFVAPCWDLKRYPQPCELPEGIKLRVYGTAFAAYSRQKNKAEPLLKVLYYEKLAASGGSSTHSSPRESRSTTPKMEANLSDLEDNLFKLLLKFDKGTYAKRLGKVYQTEYKVSPPDNILELARAMPFVLIEKITDTNEMMYMKDEYRTKYKKQDKPNKPPPPLPDTASLAEDRLNEVLVCLVNSPFSFYVQIRDSEQYQLFTNMEEEMNEYFSKDPGKGAVQVSENQLCASLWVEEGTKQWCRALVINQLDTQVNVLFPDYGNQEWVSVSDLCTLPPQFYTLPFQAIQCCLHGVLMKDSMMTNEATDYFSEMATDKVCTLQVMDSSGARVSVEILDNQLDDDETINSKLITQFHPIASLTPKLPSPGEPMIAAKLTDVDETGVLSIQVVGPGLSKLEELAKQIEERYSRGEMAAVEPVVGGMYCTEYSVDHCWYRVRVTRNLSPSEVLVEYVDYGNEDVVAKSKLRPGLDNKLFSLPPQGIKCRLAGIPPPKGMWTDSATDCLVQYIDIQELNLQVVDYCIKVTSSSSVTMAQVKLHVKDTAQEMVCVNDILLHHPTLFDQQSGANSARQAPAEVKTRAPSSVSCAVEQEKEERVAGQRTRSESSLPISLPEVDGGESETGSDSVFNRRAAAGTKQCPSKNPSGTGSSVQSSLNRAMAALGSQTCSSGRDTEGADEDNFDTSSISSLNVSSGVESELSDSASDKVKGSPRLSRTALNLKNSKSSPANKTEPLPVDSPKECIRDGVPYVASPVPGVTAVEESGHLAAPPSATRTSPSLSPSQAKSPSPCPPFSPTAPVTPPMSPPPITPPLQAKSHQTQSTPEGGGVGVVVSRWAELPSGKFVEVEVTWTSSPTNFTLLLISNKAELDLMTRHLQRLVVSEPHSSPQALCAGYVCAARYSRDSLWYRAIVTQPFQSQSMQTVVEFLDYGGSEIVPLSALKCLPEKCRNMPYQAIKASLHGISGDISNPEIVKRFEEMAYTKCLFALRKVFDPSSSRVSIILLDTTDSSGRDKVINEVLTQ